LRYAVDYTIESEKEVDGRWLAEVPQLPGVLAYGASSDEAMRKVEALALRVLAERLEQNESKAVAIRIGLKAA
jgi:predicted RNase H-like HicB family nuclease